MNLKPLFNPWWRVLLLPLTVPLALFGLLIIVVFQKLPDTVYSVFDPLQWIGNCPNCHKNIKRKDMVGL